MRLRVAPGFSGFASLSIFAGLWCFSLSLLSFYESTHGVGLYLRQLRRIGDALKDDERMSGILVRSMHDFAVVYEKMFPFIE